MASHEITLSDDALLAEYVPLDEFRGWAAQTVAVNPDLLTVLIRNGQVVSSGQGGNIGIGGFWRGIKDKLIGEHALRLLIADGKPFQMITGLNAISRDKVPVGGEITIEFQINPESGSGVMGLMREHSAVYKGEIMNRLAPHLGDRVIENVVGQIDAGELRGSTMVQDKVQAEIMREVERIAGDMSLQVRNVSLRWEINAEEIQAIEMREIEREQERADAEMTALKRELERAGTATELKLKNELDAEKLSTAGEDELRQMVLSQELAFVDARDTGTRVQEMKALEHEIALIRTEQMAKLQNAVDNTTNQLELAKLQDQIREVQRRTEDLDTRQRLTLSELEELQKIELKAKGERSSIETGRIAAAASLEKLNALTENELREKRGKLDIDESAKDGDTDRRIREMEAESRAEIARLKAQGEMSPEMMLAIQAGNSPAAAQVLVEQAKAKAVDPNSQAEMMKLMQSMLDANNRASDSKDAQNRHALDTIAKATIGVAQGAGGGAPAETEIDCSNPDCGRSVPATYKRCHHCGHQLRT